MRCARVCMLSLAAVLIVRQSIAQTREYLQAIIAGLDPNDQSILPVYWKEDLKTPVAAAAGQSGQASGSGRNQSTTSAVNHGATTGENKSR